MIRWDPELNSFVFFDYNNGGKLSKTNLDRFILKEMSYHLINKYFAITRTELRKYYNSVQVLKLQVVSSLMSELEAEEQKKLQGNFK